MPISDTLEKKHFALIIIIIFIFLIGFFIFTTGGNEKSDKKVEFVNDLTCIKPDETWRIKFAIKHVGTTDNITYDEITAYFGDDATTLQNWGPNDLAPGQTRNLFVSNKTGASWSGQTRAFKIISPAGEILKNINCP